MKVQSEESIAHYSVAYCKHSQLYVQREALEGRDGCWKPIYFDNFGFVVVFVRFGFVIIVIIVQFVGWEGGLHHIAVHVRLVGGWATSPCLLRFLRRRVFSLGERQWKVTCYSFKTRLEKTKRDYWFICYGNQRTVVFEDYFRGLLRIATVWD